MDLVSQLLDTGFLGLGVIISSLILFAIGLPVQIYKNFRRKSVEGLSLPLFLLYFSAYVVWLWYGLRIGELPIIIPNTLAAPLALILLSQFIIYRKN
jgi:uncharacterized protein with PQ loop repeat